MDGSVVSLDDQLYSSSENIKFVRAQYDDDLGIVPIKRIDFASEMRASSVYDDCCIDIRKVKVVVGGWRKKGKVWLGDNLQSRESERDIFRTRNFVRSSQNDDEADMSLLVDQEEFFSAEEFPFEEQLHSDGGFDSP